MGISFLSCGSGWLISQSEAGERGLGDIDILRHRAAGYAECTDGRAVTTSDRDASAECGEAVIRELQAWRRSAGFFMIAVCAVPTNYAAVVESCNNA
jgi:hypothetical protein